MCKSNVLCESWDKEEQQQSGDDGQREKRGSRLADVREAGVECRAGRKNGVIPGDTCASESRCLMPISDVC